MNYADVISQFLYEAVPTAEVSPEVKFEAVAAEVFGTKQRRNGPMPKPEVQVKVRDVLRRSEVVHFFLPWGSRKQVDGIGLDILDFCALKQLRCLQEGLRRYGRRCRFTFRLEDMTDLFLFGEDSTRQSSRYIRNFRALSSAMLEYADVKLESHAASPELFRLQANELMPIFLNYLEGRVGLEALEQIGWVGTIPAAQRKYYEDTYRVFYPGRNPNREMAKYFAATLTRVKQGATCAPSQEYIQICFSNEVPGNPIAGSRIYYRSIPQRFTHQHRAPWIGKGYLVIGEEGECVPKSIGVGNREVVLVRSTVEFGGAEIECDYLLG